MRTRGERRHNDWSKAIRKRNISRQYALFGFPYGDWYDNLHQFSKNKIHCSCPLCSNKTHGSQCGPAMNWCGHDLRQIERDKEELEEYYSEEELNGRDFQ